MNCCRCGGDKDMELHHILERVDSGNDEPENLEWRCRPCHKYEHARRALTSDRALGESQPDRTEAFKHRLAVLDMFNSIEAIRERGSYKPYWDDNSTHSLPPKKRLRRY